MLKVRQKVLMGKEEAWFGPWYSIWIFKEHFGILYEFSKKILACTTLYVFLIQLINFFSFNPSSKVEKLMHC